MRRAATRVLLPVLGLLCACSTPPGLGSQPGAHLVVITTGGAALSDGADDVPPTLDLRVSADQALDPSAVTALLDGQPLRLQSAQGAVTASVGAMPLASMHRLDLSVPGRDLQRIGFHVVAPAGVMAAVHRDPAGGQVLDVAFERPPAHPAVEQALPSGQARWLDDRHLQERWPAAPGGRLHLPASIATDRGSHLAAAVDLDLSNPPPPGIRRVTVPLPAPPPTATTVVAFSVATAASRSSVRGHGQQVSVLSPTGWQATRDGGIAGAPDAAAVRSAGGAGVPVWPLLQNQNFDTGAVDALLDDGSARDRLVAAILDGCASGGFGGVQLDFEAVGPDHRDQLTSLVVALAAGLHGRGLKLAVDVVPHKPGHLNLYSAAYDVPAIAAGADLVVAMAYDQHTTATDAGPVAALDWDRQVLAGTLDGAPVAKVLLGVPLYSRSWGPSGAGVADSYSAAITAALAEDGAQVDYDFAAATPVVRSASAGGRSVLWFDDGDSLTRKLALAASLGMAGVGLWRLGFEDPALWSALPVAAVR